MTTLRNNHLTVCVVRKDINTSSNILSFIIKYIKWFIMMLRNRGQAKLKFSKNIKRNRKKLKGTCP